MMVPADISRAIIAEVAAKHGFAVADISQRGRSGKRHKTAPARWEAIKRLRLERKLSTPTIGRLLNMDHSSVVIAIQRMRERGQW